ncbi:unnamed protein product [Rotaria sordida]|uniref:Peptidoglycan recognition protein family domain-containing protein n=1 Tax=Rotaria sordida TaxID=392033 RepID=A0A815IID4_9BILA|nr:unnamed protein product [Rotaria sordida]
MISQVQTKQNLFFCITIRTKKEEIVHKNGRKPTSITNLTGKPLSFYVIHHTYQPPNCYDDDECIQRVQAIQDLHQNDQGWVDIGYHFLVGENGKVYEGRGWNRQAAHSPGWNNDAYGTYFYLLFG